VTSQKVSDFLPREAAASWDERNEAGKAVVHSGKTFTGTFLVSRKNASRSIEGREEIKRKGGETL